MKTCRKSCNAALHAVLCQQIIMVGAPNNEVWFRIGSNFIRFLKYEYVLQMRLRFGDLTFDPNVTHLTPENGVYQRRVWGKFYSIEGLWEDFSKGHFKDSDDII